MVPVRAGLATYNGGEQAESFPNPSMGERVCLVPYLLRGLGFPIHPFLGRSEVMQLEAVILQESSEERVDWKPDASQQVGYEAHPFPLVGLGKFSARASPVKEANTTRTGTRSGEEGIPAFEA